MTKTGAIGDLAYFVCGTPSDKRGFEYADLGPGALPGNPPSYLDRRLDIRAHVSYGIEIVSVGACQIAVYAQSYPINPNDSEINRGAFLTVGFACTAKPSLHAATTYISHVGEIAANLRAHLKPNNTFPTGFRLKEFRYESLRPGVHPDQCSPLLRADLLLQAAHRTGRFEGRDSFTFADRDFLSDSTARYYLLYTGGDALAVECLELERARVAALAETAVHAAGLAASEHERRLAFQKSVGKELEAFADRQADLDAVLEQLQDQFKAAKRIANRATALPRVKLMNRLVDDSGQPRFEPLEESVGRKPQRHASRTFANRPIVSRTTNGSRMRKLATSYAFVAIIAAAVAIVFAVVFYRTTAPVAVERAANYRDTAQEHPSIEVKPTFEEPQPSSDVVRERAALDGRSQSDADDGGHED